MERWCIALVAGSLVVLAAPWARAQDERPESVPAVREVRLAVEGRLVEAAPPGVEVEMTVTLGNDGPEPLEDLTATLLRDVEGIRVRDDFADYGDLAPGEQGEGVFSFSHRAKPCLERLAFTLQTSYGRLSMEVPGECPGPRLFVESVAYEGGDGDGVPEPGETVEITVVVANEGRDAARDVSATLTVEGEGVRRDTAAWPDIAPGSSAGNAEPFVVAISGDAPLQQGCEGAGPIVVEEEPVSTEPDQPVVSTAAEEPPPSEPVEEPPPQDLPVRLEGRLAMRASGEGVELFFGTTIACALAEQEAGEPTEPAREARDQGGGGAALPVLIAAAVVTVVILLRRLVAPR